MIQFSGYVFVLVLTLGISTVHSAAGEVTQPAQHAKLLERFDRSTPKNASPLLRTADRNCSKDCGSNSGSASCKENETCDCSCNRQPICQCR